jgi:mRNA-degrading endonuclease RelE of RelBE toxin-antitoxin system
MEVEIEPQAEEDLDRMDNSVYLLFAQHLKSIGDNPYQRHMRSLPFFVEEVGQGRIIYTIEADTVVIQRCFATHKDYERWYRGHR